jgi:serine/threonine-protein kinase
MLSNDELMERLRAKGLLTEEEVREARRLLADADAAGRRLSLTEALIRAGVVAAKAHHVVRALGDDATDGEVQASGLKLLEKIGRGSQAVVYKCYDAATDRTVAVKILLAGAAGDAQHQQRFVQEARSAAKLSHPNIVTIHQIGFLKNTFYIVMEYVDGGTVAELLAARKRFDPAEAAAIIRQAADGLRYAHSRGFIHRDIKPQNLLITGDGVVKIADMGLARHVAGARDADAEGKAYGTPYYISPEQVTGDPPPDFRTDLYSLGATLYEMVTGRPPFTAPTPQEIMRKHVIEPLPDPRQFVPDLPPSLCVLLARALAKEPEDRYPDAEALIAAIDGLHLSGAETADSAPIAEEVAAPAEDRRRARRTGPLLATGPAGAATKPIHKRPAFLVAAAVAIVAVAAGAIVTAVIKSRPAGEPAAPAPEPPPVAYAPIPAAPDPARPSPSTPVVVSTLGSSQPAYVREDEANAAGMLKDAQDTEATDVLMAQKTEAYENVIKWYPKTKAADEARKALERLRALPPPVTLKPSDASPPEAPKPPEPVAQVGDTVLLHASKAAVHPAGGGKIRYEKDARRDNIGFWYNEDDWVSWQAKIERPGTFAVEVSYAAIAACEGNEYVLTVGDQQVAGKVMATGDWGRFKSVILGAVRVAQAGDLTIRVQPKGKPKDALMNLQSVTLKRTGD